MKRSKACDHRATKTHNSLCQPIAVFQQFKEQVLLLLNLLFNKKIKNSDCVCSVVSLVETKH